MSHSSSGRFRASCQHIQLVSHCKPGDLGSVSQFKLVLESDKMLLQDSACVFRILSPKLSLVYSFISFSHNAGSFLCPCFPFIFPVMMTFSSLSLCNVPKEPQFSRSNARLEHQSAPALNPELLLLFVQGTERVSR